MQDKPKRHLLTLSLILAAVAFGMVLAGGLGISPDSAAQSQGGPATIQSGPVASLPNFADLAERVSPAVVSVQSVTIESGGTRRGTDPFEFFFGPRRRRPDGDDDNEFRSDSGGSGFVISRDGLVVTNFHVIEGATEIRVVLEDREYSAELKGTDQATDIALLQIEPEEDLVYLELGDSDSLRVGDWAVAVGSPLGLTDSVTVGVVSAKGRQLNIAETSFENFIQTDAAINFGNSGGPLLNLKGEVVGINTAINYGSENIGFAVPVKTLKQILPQLRESGRVRRGYLGIEISNLTREASEAFGLRSTNGALVQDVLAELPADRAGIEHGDVIIAVDGNPIETTRDLIDYVSAQGPDATVVLTVVRNGEELRKKVRLSERPSGEGSEESDEEGAEGELDWLGIRYQELTPGLRSQHNLPDDVEGLWITELSPRSPLYEDLPIGNVINIIAEVNGDAIRDSGQFEDLLRESDSGDRLRIYVRRFQGGNEVSPRFVFPRVP